jgi:hypothetical protein
VTRSDDDDNDDDEEVEEEVDGDEKGVVVAVPILSAPPFRGACVPLIDEVLFVRDRECSRLGLASDEGAKRGFSSPRKARRGSIERKVQGDATTSPMKKW